MSSLELHPLFIIPATSSPVLSFQLFAFALISAAVFTLFYVPGGLAWALSRPQRRHIPGPSGLPVVGIVAAFLGPLTHRVLSRLAAASNAKKLMAFSVGFTRYVIASDPETAKEMLSSSAFADRPLKESAYELLFHRAMGFAPYGEYWRNLRRISATHLFSPRRIAASGPFRQEIGLKMVSEIESSMSLHGAVEIRRVLHFGSLNNVMKSVFGRCYDFHGNDIVSVELKSLVREGYDLLGVFNWSDHFPILGWFDLQGVRRRCRKLVERVNAFVGNVIEEHRAKRAANGGADGGHGGDDGSGDFVDVLLDLEKENRLSDSDLVAVLWEMIFRGTDTVAILLEWILARMTLHPDIQAKAQHEIDAVVGPGQSVSDSDLPNLPYLRAIVKETLRIHPPGPLLSWARLAIHDTSVGQHFIPAGTTAMVNMWAITHDGSVWSDPDEFKPERFVEEDVPIMGSDLRLAPFGSGRRVCPGKAMGLATVELWLAQLLQNFKWVPSEECGVDLTEILKLSMEMKRSLVCKAIPREG
ncbi:cytochrome P450 78A5-like [Punica granatum]|uniref:Cytochrome P450 78A5-like n=1 Tax=Punica granatum TaxID=22663 RepID=A0A6P8BNW9_PUNGR|nr:cytochrome P450 78A5-like [Punica granatum]